MSHPKKMHWWKTAAFYQIYVRSFMDSDGDGVGDLNGIRSKLDDLQWLGVDALWLTPFYPSPQADFGYDVADYAAVDPTYGTLDDFDALLADIHARGMRLIIDLVPNHTSDQHPWFQESKSSRTNPKRDWYVWRDPGRDGGPPNNWISDFGGSSWKLDATTGQYYYHACLPQQPDLNWRNAEVREAMHGVMRFWLERGIDGFRVDAADHLLEDELLRNNPPNPHYTSDMPPMKRFSSAWNRNQPESRDLFRELAEVADEYGERFLIGEVHVPTGQLDAYYGTHSDEFDMPFNFMLLGDDWHANTLREKIDMYYGRLAPCDWPNWVLGNHDEHRVAGRIGRPLARIAATLQLTLRGTPFIYYGDELGMRNVPISPEAARDPRGKLVPGTGFGRDPERTPMQWDATHAAGFSSGTPWLPIADDYETVNVAAERRDPTSMLNLYRRLLLLRREQPVLIGGEYVPVASPEGVIAYLRTAAEKTLLITLNVTDDAITWKLPMELASGRVLLSTRLDREGRVECPLELRGTEGLIVEIDPA